MSSGAIQGNERVEVRAFLVAGSSTCCTAGDIEQSLHSKLMCVCPRHAHPFVKNVNLVQAGKQVAGQVCVCECVCVSVCVCACR